MWTIFPIDCKACKHKKYFARVLPFTLTYSYYKTESTVIYSCKIKPHETNCMYKIMSLNALSPYQFVKH